MSRPFRDDRDAAVMAEIASRAASVSPRCSYWHPGDVWWGLYHDMQTVPGEMARIWEDGGQPVAFALVYSDGSLGWTAVPEWDDTALLDREIVACREEQARTLPPGPERPHRLSLTAFDGDEAREALFAELGFRRGDSAMLHFAQSLHRQITPAPLPAGFSVGNVGGEEEWEERVNAHRDVWNPSKVTLPAYRRLRTLPGYRADLDLVVRSPEGEVAAYCIVWWDERNGTGEFEPVGTRASYRGRGLGRAVIVEGLRRLQGLGAQYALVYTPRSNRPASALYESCGFQVAGEEYFWLLDE